MFFAYKMGQKKEIVSWGIIIALTAEIGMYIHSRLAST